MRVRLSVKNPENQKLEKASNSQNDKTFEKKLPNREFFIDFTASSEYISPDIFKRIKVNMLYLNQPKLHWKFYLSLEEDFLKSSRYVEISKQNKDTFSIEYLRLILAIGSEIDVVSKKICETINASSKVSNIKEYKSLIEPKYTLSGFEIISNSDFGNLIPWSEWSVPDKSPIWWSSYNNVKHNRSNHYSSDANLKNVLESLGGLYVLNLYLYKDAVRAAELIPASSFFQPNMDCIKTVHMAQARGYALPSS